MKKVKCNEVPKDYRRNYKKEAVELLYKLVFGAGFGLLVMWMVWMA